MSAEFSFPTVFPELETVRLVLRELTDADTEALFEIHSDAETMRYWSGPPMTEEGEARAIVERAGVTFAAGTSIRWGVVLRETDELVGSANLHSLDVQSRRCEIGYILGRSHWGHGYNHEALTRILDYAFDDLGLHRVEAELDPRNEGSARAVERLGFVREGLLRERWIVEGEISDSLLVGLLRTEWRAG